MYGGRHDSKFGSRYLTFIVKWQEGSGEEGEEEEEEEEESSGDDEDERKKTAANTHARQEKQWQGRLTRCVAGARAAAMDAAADAAKEQQRQEAARKWSEYQRRCPIRPDVELILWLFFFVIDFVVQDAT